MFVRDRAVGVNAQRTLARLRDNFDACEIKSIVGIAIVCCKVDYLWGSGLNDGRIILSDGWIVGRGNRNRYGCQSRGASRNIADTVGEAVDCGIRTVVGIDHHATYPQSGRAVRWCIYN
jgi:hypothetical protein